MEIEVEHFHVMDGKDLMEYPLRIVARLGHSKQEMFETLSSERNAVLDSQVLFNDGRKYLFIDGLGFNLYYETVSKKRVYQGYCKERVIVYDKREITRELL